MKRSIRHAVCTQRRGSVAKLSRYRKRIAVFNSLPAPAFPGNQCPASGFLYRSAASPFPHRNGTSFPCQSGITVNKTTQTVESAEAGGAFHIEDVYPLIDGGRFPVKRIVGERVEVWADIYRDGHEVIAAALVWRREHDREWRREPMTHAQQRPLGRLVRARPARALCLCHRGLDRRIRDLAARFRAEAEGRRRPHASMPSRARAC